MPTDTKHSSKPFKFKCKNYITEKTLNPFAILIEISIFYPICIYCDDYFEIVLL